MGKPSKEIRGVVFKLGKRRMSTSSGTKDRKANAIHRVLNEACGEKGKGRRQKTYTEKKLRGKSEILQGEKESENN